DRKLVERLVRNPTRNHHKSCWIIRARERLVLELHTDRIKVARIDEVVGKGLLDHDLLARQRAARRTGVKGSGLRIENLARVEVQICRAACAAQVRRRSGQLIAKVSI